MSLATIIVLLQMAVSLLVSSTGASPAARQQAFTFANQAISLANEALLQPSETSLATIVSTSTPPAFPEIAAPSADSSSNTSGTVATSTPMEPKTISVSFALTGDDGYVTVMNDSGVAVRVKDLDVPGGTIAGVTIGTVYGQGFVYPASFTDSLGNKFEMFTCTGLGSLGQASLPGSNLDPCARRDASGLAKNELQPNETMIIRYVKSGEDAVSAAVYQAGSIVETGTGNDVTF